MRLVLLVVMVIATRAHAQGVFGGMDYTAARGSRVEHFDLGWRLEVGPFLQVGHWHATTTFIAFMHVRSDLPERDGPDLGGLGWGGRIAYHVPVDHHGVLLVALGIDRLWLTGETEVRRGCRQTGTCMFGYYTEVPHYDAWAPQLRVGIGPFAPPPDLKLGATFELIVQPINITNVPPDGARGIAVFAALTATIGGGRP
jgi:hypothetical protein